MSPQQSRWCGVIPAPRRPAAGSNLVCHRPRFSCFRNQAFETLNCESCARSHADTQRSTVNATHSGHGGDGCSVGAVSITVDIVCHHYNGMGLENMPAREKNKSSWQLRWRKLVQLFTFSKDKWSSFRQHWQESVWTMRRIRPLWRFNCMVN